MIRRFLYKFVLAPLLRFMKWDERDPNDTDGDGQFG